MFFFVFKWMYIDGRVCIWDLTWGPYRWVYFDEWVSIVQLKVYDNLT